LAERLARTQPMARNHGAERLCRVAQAVSAR
jgi:hypothetical protein